MAGWPTPLRAPDGHAGGMTATTSTQGSGPVARHAGAASRRPTATAGPAIQVDGLRKKFGRVAAVDDVSFSVSYGRITGFLGPNGAGKTTTLRMILGLIRPDAGTAVIAGKPYATLASPARTVGALLDAAAAHPGRSGRDHLRVLAAQAGIPGRRAGQLLERVGLADAARQRAGRYSLGMRQRLGLAGALLGDPEVLVLDEPGNGLDPQGIRWLRDLLRSLAAEGRVVLVSSHVLAEVAQTVDDVVVISRGRLVEQGPVTRLTSGGHVVVRTPRTAELRAALEQAGMSATGEGDELMVDADDPARVGDVAFAAGVPVHELTTRASSLEEAFLALTSDEEPIG